MVIVTATEATGTGLPFGRALTVRDLTELPADGHRYELLDGTLLVSPAPAPGHQLMLGSLYSAMSAACPAELIVAFAPLAVQFDATTELQPDLIVAPLRAFTSRNLPTAPLLAVEIESPSTATIDRTLKRAAYARFGVPTYWLVDPDPDQPAITVLTLRGEEYVEEQTVRGDEELVVDQPFTVTLRPSDLVIRLPDA